MTARHLLRIAFRRLPGRQILRTFAFRTGAIKWWWRYRHFLDGSYREAPPLDDAVAPHRHQLWSLISPLSATSLIEVGCGDGGNLALFASHSQQMRLWAVDVNPLALGIAEQRVRRQGGATGEFRVAPANHLPMPSSCVDIALSDAVFMYLPQSVATAALREMRRVARKAIIVHTFADMSLAESAVIGGNWVHNIPVLILRAIPGATVTQHKSRVDHGQWAEYGTVFTITW